MFGMDDDDIFGSLGPKPAKKKKEKKASKSAKDKAKKSDGGTEVSQRTNLPVALLSVGMQSCGIADSRHLRCIRPLRKSTR